MVRVKTCLVAEQVLTDRDTGQVTAVGLIDDLEAPSFPFAIQKIAFLCLLERGSDDPHSAPAEFSATLNGDDVARQSVDIDFQQHLRTRFTVRLGGFTLSEPGEVIFRLVMQGHEAAEWRFRARGAPAPASIAAGPARPARSTHMYESAPVSMALGAATKSRA